MKSSAAGSGKSKRKGGFPSLLSRAKGNPFSSRRIPAKQGQQGKLEPTVPVPKYQKPVNKIKFTKATARGNDDDEDRDSSKMSSLSDHDELFRLMRDSGQNPAPATITVTTNTPQKEVTKVKVQPAPAAAQEIPVVPTVVTAQVPADKNHMEIVTMNVNANGIVAVNKDKKHDSPSLPSSEDTNGSSQFSYGKAFQGDASHSSPQPSATKTSGASSKRDKSVQLFENHLMFDKQDLRPQQQQPPPKQQPQQKQRPSAVAVAVAATTHQHLHQPFVPPGPPKFEKLVTKTETQEKIMDLDKGRKVAPPSPITLDRVGVQGTQEHSVKSNMARAQSQPQPQAAISVDVQERPKTPVILLKDRSKNPDSLLERSKTTVSLLEKSKMPLSLLEKSKNPGSLLAKSQTPFSLLERSKAPASSLKGKTQTPVSIEEKATLKSSELKQQPQQRGAGYTHLAIADATVIMEFMSVLAVKKGLSPDSLSESSPHVPGTPKKNDLVQELVRKINASNASSESSPRKMPWTPRENGLARNVAFDKVTALLNRLHPPSTANSEPPVAVSDSTREQLPHVATASSSSTSFAEPHIFATHSATSQQNDVIATTCVLAQRSIAATRTTEPHNVDGVSAATTSALDQHSDGSAKDTKLHTIDGLSSTTASTLNQHSDGSAAKDPTPRARDERTVGPFENPQSPPKASERSAMETPQDAPTSTSVSRVPVDAPEYICLTEMLDSKPKALAADERNASKDLNPTELSNAATDKKKMPTTLSADDKKALQSLKNDFKSATLMQKGVAQLTSYRAAGRDTQQRFSSDQIVIDVENELVMSAETRQRIDDSSETKQSIVDLLSVEENSARSENSSVTRVGESGSKESKTPTPTRLMLSLKTNPYDDSSDEDIPAPVVDAAAMMAALESTLPPRSTVNRKKSTSPRKKGKSPRKSKKLARAANPPSPLMEANDMKETLRRKAEKKAEKHKSQHGQQKCVMTETEARFLARQAMENATRSKFDLRDPPAEKDSDLNDHPLKEVVFSGDETVSDLDQSIQKFPIKNIVVEETSCVSLLDQSKKDLDVDTKVSNDEEMDRYAPLISPGKDDSVLDAKERQIDESKRPSPRQALADSITEWSIEEVETEDTGDVAVEVMLNSCSQTPLGQRLVQRWFGQKAVVAKVAQSTAVEVKGQSAAVETEGLAKKKEDRPEDLLRDQLVSDTFKRACGGKEYKVPPNLSQKSTVRLPDNTPVASNARKPNHFFAHDTSEEEDSGNDESLEQGNFTKPYNLREPLGREPIPSLDQQSHRPITPREPDGRTQLLYQSGEDPPFAGSGEISSVLTKEQEVHSCLDIYHAASDIDRYHAVEETPRAKSRYDPEEPPARAKRSLIPLGQIQEQERDFDDQIAGEQDTSLVSKIVEFGHNMMCLSPSSQNDVKNAMRVLGPASLVLLERSIRKAEQGKEENVTDSISQDPSRESKHSIEVSIVEENDEIEVGPLVTEAAGDGPSSKNSKVERDVTPAESGHANSAHVLSPTSQELLKRSICEADDNKNFNSLQHCPSYESKNASGEDSVDGRSLGPSENASGKSMDEENEKIALKALIKDVTEGLSLGATKLESTKENGVGGATLEASVGKQSSNDELFEILKADSSHSNLELIDLTGVDSADDVDDGVWLFDLSPKNDLTDGFLHSESDLDSLKEYATARLGPGNKTAHLSSDLLQSHSDVDSLKSTAVIQQGSEEKTKCAVNDAPNLLIASLEDIIEYAAKLLLLSNDEQDKAAVESSLVVVKGIDVSFGETAKVRGLEVTDADSKAIDFGTTKLVEPTETKAVDLDHTEKKTVEPAQANTVDLIEADVNIIEPRNKAKETGLDEWVATEQATTAKKEATKTIDLTDIEPTETIDLTDMPSVDSGEASSLTVIKPARSEQVELTERPLSNSRSEDARSNEAQGSSASSCSQKPNLKDTVTHPSGKQLAEDTECERSVKEGQAESKNNAGDTMEKIQVEVTDERVDSEDEREELKFGASEGKTSEKAKVAAREVREDETDEKITVDGLEVREVEKEEKTSVVVTTQKRDILDFLFESTEMFLCGPLQGRDVSGAQGRFAPSSDSYGAISLKRVPESQPCEVTEDLPSCENGSIALVPQQRTEESRPPTIDRSAEERETGDVPKPDILEVGGVEKVSTTPDVSTPDILEVGGVEKVSTTPTGNANRNLSLEDSDDQRAKVTNATETYDEIEDASIPNRDDTSPSNSKEGLFRKGLLDYLSEDGEESLGAEFLVDGKDREDQRAEATNAGKTSDGNEDGSIPKCDDTSLSISKEGSLQKGLFDDLIEVGKESVGAEFLVDGKGRDVTNVGETSDGNEDGSIPKSDDTSPSNSKEESFRKGLLDYLIEDGEESVGAEFLAKYLNDIEAGSGRNNDPAPSQEDDSSCLESSVLDLSKRRKAPAPEDRLPQRFTREKLKQKKAPAPEDRAPMELRIDDARSSVQTFLASKDKKESEQRKTPVPEERARGNLTPRLPESRPDNTSDNDTDHEVDSFLEDLVDSESSQDSVYTSGSKTPSVISERNTSKAPRVPQAFAPKPEIAPTRRIQQKQDRQAPKPEILSLEKSETKTSHKDASDISEILGHFFGDAAGGQIQSSKRAVEVIDVEARSIKEKSERQHSTRAEKVIVRSSSMGDYPSSQKGDSIISTNEEVDSRVKSSMGMPPPGERDGRNALALMDTTSEGDSTSSAAGTQQKERESHTGSALTDISQSSYEEVSTRSWTSENALTDIAAAAALALTVQVSQSINDEVSIRSSTRDEEIVDVSSRFSVRDADNSTEWEGMEIVEVHGHSTISESDVVFVRRADDDKEVSENMETTQVVVDKNPSPALCRNDEPWIVFPCIGHQAEIDQQAGNYAEINQQATNDESRGTSEGGTDDEIDLQGTNDESRGDAEGGTVGDTVFNEKPLYLALGSMDTQATEIDPHTEAGTVDESTVLQEKRLVEPQNLCWVPWPSKSPGNEFNQANVAERAQLAEPETEERVPSESLEEKTWPRASDIEGQPGTPNVCWLPWESTETINAETDKSTEHGYSKRDDQRETAASWLPWSQTKSIPLGDIKADKVDMAKTAKVVERDINNDDEANADESATRIIAAAAAAVVVEGSAKKVMNTEADKEVWNESPSEEASHAGETSSLEAHKISANTANKSIGREGLVDISAAATIVAVAAAASRGTAAAAEISNQPSEDASYTNEVASSEAKSAASVQSKAKSTTSIVSKAKSTASLKAKLLAVSAKTKSAPSPKAKSTSSSLRASSKVKTTASPSKSTASSNSAPLRAKSAASFRASRHKEASTADSTKFPSTRSRPASIPHEISITKGETDALSTTASISSGRNISGLGNASSAMTASSISASPKSQDIKSTTASQEDSLVPLAIAAQRSKQVAEQTRSSNGASSLASTADVAKHQSQLNISRFGSTSGEEPLDAPPPRASASVSSKQHSDFSPTSGRFGSVSGDESMHAPPAHSFSSEAAMQNSLASPGSEMNHTSPRESNFFSRIEEEREEIESQSECPSSVDETSLLLALTRSETEEHAISPTSDEQVDTAVQDNTLRAAAALDAAAAVVTDTIPRRGNRSKRSILQRMRGTSLVSGTRSKASSQPLSGVSNETTQMERERERDQLSTVDSSSLDESGERSNLGTTSSTESATETAKLRARKAFLRAPRLETVLDRLGTRKGDGDSDSVTSSNAGPVEISALFTRYDSIVKHMVVFDESRLQSQTPDVIDVTDVSTERSPSPAPTNDGSVGAAASTDGRPFPQITDLTDPIYGASRSSSDDKNDKESDKRTLTSETRRIIQSSSSETTADTTTPSQKARNLRQQLDQALHTSTMIRDSQERLGAELNTFKSRLEQQRRNGSPQRSIISAPPMTESISTITNSTALVTKADSKEPPTASTGITPVSSSSVSFQSRIDRVEERRRNALSRSKATQAKRIEASASPTFDQVASAFDRLKSGRSQNESPKTSDEDAVAVRKIGESAVKALLDEENDNSSEDEGGNHADDDRIKKATVHADEFADDEVQLQNLESIIQNIRDAEDRKREVTSRRIVEAKRSVTGSSASLVPSATSSIPVISIEFDNELDSFEEWRATEHNKKNTNK